MSLPVIVLITADPALAADAAEKMAGAADWLVCRSVKDGLDALDENVAWGCLLDLRQMIGGGHAEVRFLELLTERFPDLQRLLLVSPIVPEIIERFCACHPAHRFAAPIDAAELAAAITRLLPLAEPAATDLPAVAAPERAAEDDTVLSGLTRRFETRTPKTRLMLRDLEVAARHDVTVLLIGETGAGKTFLSKLIHEISPRHAEPFLPVACGALPSDLIESELFGHVRGAFTSAHADKDGKFVAAGRGTILLDEIDVLGPDQQVKLLRVIESGEFEPVGSNQTVKSRARLIVASNLELQPLVQQGKFRPDLYYRLNMLKFEIPPLRSRKPDIIPLAEGFIHQLATKHGVNIHKIEQSFYAALYAYPWPGNVRELENVVQRAVIYCSDGVLTAQQLPSYILLGMAGPTNDASVNLDGPEDSAGGRSPTLGRQIAFTERDIIEQTLHQNNYSRTGTAKALGISRVTLYNKMKKYGMS